MPSDFAEVSELLQDGGGHFHDYRSIFLGGKHRKNPLPLNYRYRVYP